MKLPKDSIPIKVTKGEYVVNAGAVKRHGVAKLDKINQKGLPKGVVMKAGKPVKRGRIKTGVSRRRGYRTGGRTSYQQGGLTDAMSIREREAYKKATGEDIGGSSGHPASTVYDRPSSQGVRASSGGQGVTLTAAQKKAADARLKSLMGMRKGGLIKVTRSDAPRRTRRG